MTLLIALIILLLTLGTLFVLGVWYARHHHAKINASLTVLHGKVDVLHYLSV